MIASYVTIGALVAMLGCTVVPVVDQDATATPLDYLAIAEQVEESLKKDILDKWYPRAVDKTHGGFHQYFNHDWTRGEGDERSVVYQARLTWMAAEAAKRYKSRSVEFTEYSRHGLDFLNHRLWDAQDGGFFWAVTGEGKPVTTEKHSYGIAFAIYAAAANYRVTRNPQALELAQRGFNWLDTHAHDSVNGGYYEALQRNGKPIAVTENPESVKDAIGTRKGYKSMNTHIHLLEALTELYRADKTSRVGARLQEIFDILCKKIASPEGYLRLFFTPDWKPTSDMDSYGHDIETAYLILEAARALGKGEDATVQTLSRRLVNHTIMYGMDKRYGGFYDSGPINGSATERDKIWWTQAEALNALLLMDERYRSETPEYGKAFVRQWEFIQKYQIDKTHGGWYPTLHPDGTPLVRQGKSDAWTDPYHQGRALLHVSAALQK